MVSYAIVGASRGIGLEYVCQLAARPDAIVFAIVRNARTSTFLTAAIAALKNVHVIEADVVDFATLQVAAKAVSSITGGTLDCLIHNAARTESDVVMRGFDDYASMDALDAEFLTSFEINTLGLVHSITAFLPLLRASTAPIKKIVAISTGGAVPECIRAIGSPTMVAYCTTKASELMAATKWAVKLKDEGFVVVSMRPGVVDTSETSDAAARENFRQFSAGANLQLHTPQESVAAQLKVVDELKLSDNGLFLEAFGA